MVIHAGNGDLAGSLGAGLMLKMGIPQTSTIVWDLRGSRMPYQLSSRPDISQIGSNGIGYAYREHSGYPPQDALGLRYYYSSLQIVEPQGAATRQTALRRQVYLIDKDSAVPFQAIIDQVNGRTAILSEDPPGPMQAGFTELVRLLGKVVAEVRLADVRYPDGTTEFAPTRVVLNRGEEAVKAAIGALSAGWGMPGERPKFVPGPAGFRDMPYAGNPYPSREMRMLSAFRIWGVLHYFHPFVSTMGEKWDDVFVEFLPRFAQARDAREYHRAVAAMVARTGDPAGAARSPELLDLFGPALPPLEVRFIENQPVITRVFAAGEAQPGDVILRIDGAPVQERIDELSRYISAPNARALQSQAARSLLAAGALGKKTLKVLGRDGKERDITVPVADARQRAIPASRGGDASRLINERIAYADLERVQSADLDAVFAKFHETPAIIFDLRGYPRNSALELAARLGDRTMPVAAEMFRNVVGLGGGLGATDSHIRFMQSELRVPRPAANRYTGKTVALIDDVALTGEIAMYLKAANNTVLVGSAAFPVFPLYWTSFDAPGGIKVIFNGQMPRWPGGKLVYPDGVLPDVDVRPTLAGLRAGRDEALDAAVEYLAKNLN
jgi:hypothetical protein